MSRLDYAVLIATILGIAGYGTWRTRGRSNLKSYLRGTGTTGWLAIGLSVMATQASAITFLSTPGQGYESGMGFVQNYFGAPLALVIVAAVFLPRFRRLDVDTAYEFLGRRFDRRTRLLGAGLFLLQRGLGAGITIYAPAIVLSSVLGWRLDLTIVGSGALVIAYTAAGGSAAVSLTQQFQMGVIFAGMVAAFVVVLLRLPPHLTLTDALTVAGGFGKIRAVDYSLDLHPRYTVWSGLFGGLFLALAYFGTDQSQVQRYLHGASLRESRLGLMFNAVWKVPMQAFILLLGALVFVFYQFERPPIFFNEAAWRAQAQSGRPGPWAALEREYAAGRDRQEQRVQAWIAARHAGDARAEASARAAALAAEAANQAVRRRAGDALHAADPRTSRNDADFVFITFVLHHLPEGLVGLLVAVIFAAAMSSKAAELNALGSTTTIDLYRHVIRPGASDAHYVAASRWFTAGWGVAAVVFALSVSLTENLIQWANIVGSIFYGVPLGLFLVAFFLKRVGGTAVFWGALAAQTLVLALYFLRQVWAPLDISYLWYNVIGCGGCVALSLVLQGALGLGPPPPAPASTPA
jgi:Na+/proline symporter